MSAYAVSRLDEIDEITDGRCPWRPVRLHFDIRSFGANAFTGKEAGDRIINEHVEEEDEQEELYFVHTGRARFELDDESVDAGTGTFVFVPTGIKRTAFAEEANTTILALGGTPGKAYEAFGWELWAPLNGLYQSGQYAEAADRGKEVLAANPGYPMLAYNVACCESLAGRKQDAIEHLKAIGESEQLRSLAAKDSDLDPIRDEPGFKEILEVG
jgi:mannose-6-phosphate isomerase-like protein (cupin superfamily)